MSVEEAPDLARRVIVGSDSMGRSAVLSDGPVSTWVKRLNGLLVMEAWRTAAVPSSPESEILDDEELRFPGLHGVSVRIAVFPPDREIDSSASASYDASIAAVYGDAGERPSRVVPGMHKTETVDIVTVVDGEIWAILEEGETLLRAGDCLVQRRGWHAWQNRSDRPCTVVSTVVPALTGE